MASNFGGEGTVTYTYGGDQKRRSRAVSGGSTTQYRYDQGWAVLNEEDGSGTLQATYVHHPGRRIGTVLATSEGTSASTGDWAYYFQDAIGSTRGVWDDAGDRLGRYEYTPFGGKYADHGEDITRKFTGHDWDQDARLYYTAYRYYSPDANRWLTRDPLGMVDGPNVYAYVVNNPVSMWDALGQCSDNGLLPDGTSEALVALACIAAFFVLMVGVVRMFGSFTSIGHATLACASAIYFAILGYLALGFDPSTDTGQVIAAMLGATAATACVVSFLVMAALAVGPFGGAGTMVFSRAIFRSSAAPAAWLTIFAAVPEGIGCGASIAGFVAAVR